MGWLWKIWTLYISCHLDSHRSRLIFQNYFMLGNLKYKSGVSLFFPTRHRYIVMSCRWMWVRINISATVRLTDVFDWQEEDCVSEAVRDAQDLLVETVGVESGRKIKTLTSHFLTEHVSILIVHQVALFRLMTLGYKVTCLDYLNNNNLVYKLSC